MYADDQAWQADIDQVLSMAEEFSAYQGRLTESAAALSAAFQEKRRALAEAGEGLCLRSDETG